MGRVHFAFAKSLYIGGPRRQILFGMICRCLRSKSLESRRDISLIECSYCNDFISIAKTVGGFMVHQPLFGFGAGLRRVGEL
jgi:hypothetical protein